MTPAELFRLAADEHLYSESCSDPNCLQSVFSCNAICAAASSRLLPGEVLNETLEFYYQLGVPYGLGFGIEDTDPQGARFMMLEFAALIWEDIHGNSN
jgi:hypothetical protein